jgi:hypothetical protein
MRSISETVNSMVKCRFGAATRGNNLNRGRRLRRGSKLVGHNIQRVGYLEIMGDVVPHWGDVREFCPKARIYQSFMYWRVGIGTQRGKNRND